MPPSSNRIGEEGARQIAEGLKENATLRSLQLNGAAACAAANEVNGTELACAAGNSIGDAGAMLVIEAVGQNCSVRDLGLQDCHTRKRCHMLHRRFAKAI